MIHKKNSIIIDDNNFSFRFKDVVQRPFFPLLFFLLVFSFMVTCKTILFRFMHEEQKKEERNEVNNNVTPLRNENGL